MSLKTISKELGRPLVVLQRWAKAGRFKNMVDTTGRATILVPLSEIPVIAALPKGKGNYPHPWKKRAAKLLREGKITLLTDEQQDEALDQSALKYVEETDGSYRIVPLARPSFTEEQP